ncbi:MAG TPA: hypothetical protein VLS91_00020, partial [Acidimicrobiales bacterium]|nr:hypothetical protein [Acidimicrobiales bacterium]
TANCSLSGAVLSATTGGTCTVTANKAGDSSYLPVSSTATTITFAASPTPPPTPRPAPHAVRVVGVVHTGARTEVTIVGVGFYGQPRITSNAGGTRVLVHHDNGRQLVVSVIVARNVRKGVHTLTLVFSHGQVTRVTYIQR